MYRIKQIVEVLYQGRWIQGTVMEHPEGENNDCFIVNCGLAQFIARTTDEIRPVRKYHVMTAQAGAGEYRRGTVLEEFYAFDGKLALKIARQYWGAAANPNVPSQKACVYQVVPEDGVYEFVGHVDEKKKEKQ